MSVRKIKKSYISCTGYFASNKNKAQIAFESTLERDFYMLLEFDNNVIKFEEQPMRIKYEHTNKKRKYTPDTLVTYKDGTQKLYEVKYLDEFKSDPKLQYKIDILKEHILKEYSIEFDVFTDDMINGIYLDNLKFLYKFVNVPILDDKLDSVQKIIHKNEVISVQQILASFTDSKIKQLEYIPYIWHYACHHIDQLNLHDKLNMNTNIYFKDYIRHEKN
ncbi:MAG: Tn7 transposase TnsA N-terminal domain-containing protein [Thiovulaceae bacterium]|nr:Tn7 transposase TnsA N-terminal domain-containing protein [Sulfurimonadaceae bacterium]